MPRALALALLFVPLLATAGEHAHHAPKLDTRQAIPVSAEEAMHIRLEMRAFLSGAQKIVTAAAADDLPTVARAARELGVAAAHEVPAGLRAKLPQTFRQLGHATHEGFDDLARDADSLGDANHALRQLGAVMSNCVSCHASFRLETGATAKR
jgi:cytochrome c556